jgi:hypothetical protein
MSLPLYRQRRLFWLSAVLVTLARWASFWMLALVAVGMFVGREAIAFRSVVASLVGVNVFGLSALVTMVLMKCDACGQRPTIGWGNNRRNLRPRV